MGFIGFKNDRLTVKSIKIFKNTPAWELVKAVDKENIAKINEIIKRKPDLVNYKEPIYGTTLLMRAISSEKYSSTKALLDHHANPNIIANTGSSALFRAVSHSWYDSKASDDPKYLKLLLKHNGNPNLIYCAPKVDKETSPIECGTSLLMHAVSRSFLKTRLLIEAGADIQYKTKTGKTASVVALMMKDIDAAYHLIVEKNADITAPYYFYSLTDNTIIEIDKPHYPVDLLLDWIYEISSNEYSKKMAIVQQFKNQGVDYFERKDKISTLTLNRIKKLHPNDWEEFINKY